MRYPTLAHFRHFSHFRHSFNYNIFPDTLFMQNKPNFGISKMNITLDITSNYKILPRLERPKNKANSNPIQSQFNPKQTQFNPISNPNKPNFERLELLVNRMMTKIFKIYLLKMFDSWPQFCRIIVFV